MTVAEAEMVWTVVAVYLAAGVIIGAPFMAFGLARLDYAAKGASRGFRLVVAPGVIALWPFILVRWLSGRVINRPIDREPAS